MVEVDSFLTLLIRETYTTSAKKLTRNQQDGVQAGSNLFNELEFVGFML